MPRDIQLDGAEVSVIKSLGMSGDTEGSVLMERCSELDPAELIDTVRGLISVGYVDSESDAFHSEEEFAKIHFRVNSNYAKELRDALDPMPDTKKSKRVRRD